MTDLVEFLRARLDEDARIAQAARVEGDLTINFEPAGGEQEHPGEGNLLAHIASWDPGRVLAEVEAKRGIIDLHKSDHECSSYNPIHKEVDNCYWVIEGESCSTVRLLALPYADHPDYDPAWAPEQAAT